jgi:hypothetical protein
MRGSAYAMGAATATVADGPSQFGEILGRPRSVKLHIAQGRSATRYELGSTGDGTLSRAPTTRTWSLAVRSVRRAALPAGQSRRRSGRPRLLVAPGRRGRATLRVLNAPRLPRRERLPGLRRVRPTSSTRRSSWCRPTALRVARRPGERGTCRRRRRRDAAHCTDALRATSARAADRDRPGQRCAVGDACLPPLPGSWRAAASAGRSSSLRRGSPRRVWGRVPSARIVARSGCGRSTCFVAARCLRAARLSAARCATSGCRCSLLSRGADAPWASRRRRGGGVVATACACRTPARAARGVVPASRARGRPAGRVVVASRSRYRRAVVRSGWLPCDPSDHTVSKPRE